MKKIFVNAIAFAVSFAGFCVNANAEETEVMTEEETLESEVVPTTEIATEAPRKMYASTPEPGQTLAPALQAMNPNAPDWMKDVADRITLHGYAQGGYTYTNQNGVNTNTFDIKRTLLWATAQITPRWSFCFMHDFNSKVQEYYTDYRVTKNNAFTVRFGQFKNGCTFENPLSPTSMETIDVYSEGVTYLTGCGSDPLFGVQYGRDLGMSFFGETNNKFFRYEVDLLNGQGINQKDKNNKKDVIARLEVRPFDGLNIVATGQLGYGNALVGGTVFNPTMVAGQDYKRNRWSAGFDYKSKAFNMHGEYLEGKDGDALSRGAYVTGSTKLLTFKDKTSLDFIASYDYFNFNVDQKNDMHKVVAGFQYWFFKRCRIQAQYIYKSAITNYSSVYEKKGNHAIMCQMQIRFN